MPRLLKSAILCGAIPLFVGTLIYITWRFTRLEFLMVAGLITIAVGLLAFITGVACLLSQPWHHAAGDLATRHLRFQGFFAVGLLLVNFPSAAFFTLSAIDIHTRYTLVVVNESDTVVDSFVVTAPGVSVEFGPIPVGKRAQKHLHFFGDGTLDFAARQQQQQISGRLENYVSRGSGGNVTIRVRPRGAYETHSQMR